MICWSATLQRLRDELVRAGLWKKRAPFIAIFVLILAFSLSIALPGFIAVNGTARAVFGGQWLRWPEREKKPASYMPGEVFRFCWKSYPQVKVLDMC